MPQTIVINDSDADELDFSDINRGEFYTRNDKIFIRIDNIISNGDPKNTWNITDGNYGNHVDTWKVRLYNTVTLNLEI